MAQKIRNGDFIPELKPVKMSNIFKTMKITAPKSK